MRLWNLALGALLLFLAWEVTGWTLDSCGGSSVQVERRPGPQAATPCEVVNPLGDGSLLLGAAGTVSLVLGILAPPRKLEPEAVGRDPFRELAHYRPV